MRFKLSSFAYGLAITLGTLILLYQLISLPNDFQSNSSNKKDDIGVLENRLKKLEDNIHSNQVTIKEIKSLIKTLSDADLHNGVNLLLEDDVADRIVDNHINKKSDAVNPKFKSLKIPAPIYNTSKASIQADDCNFAHNKPSGVDVQMSDVYEKLPFDNLDGGSWKQGWTIDYDPTQWSPENKLRVFVVPHSHNDPGWLKTFERYFEDQTRHILDNMVIKLSENHKMKFIWAEISYFMLWWDRQPVTIKDAVKKLIEAGQLEIVTGGWVMPDEASSHYYAIINQLLTGHEWMQLNLGVKPTNGWSIDPFGMSPTMAYILKRSGFKNMLIQRTHYSIKKYFAKEKSLEFRWRQMWDPESSTDILTHMMPFYSYDVPHTCGPDPKVCCQFDFRRITGSGVTCPWRIAPQPISDRNVDPRSRLLLDQYRKKAQLYRTNVVLVPLGDDFRYDSGAEWDNQYNNYQMLFDHMNAAPDLNVEAKFGTLSDYFTALRDETTSLSGSEDTFFPSFSGDFFSYADRDEHYWTGYFTTRPFYKRMDRTLIGYLRSAEILYAIMLEINNQGGWARHQQEVSYALMDNLDGARRNHALFQHHDGITGTSKNHVVTDYANRMLGAVRTSQHVIQQAAHTILSLTQTLNTEDDESTVYFELSENFKEHDTVPFNKVLSTASKKIIYLFNPEAHLRQQIITVTITSPYVEVLDAFGKNVLCQVDSRFTTSGAAHFNEFDLHFLANLDALSLSSFTIRPVDPTKINPKHTSFAEVFHKNLENLSLPSVFKVLSYPASDAVELKCGKLSAKFNAHGLLLDIGVGEEHIFVKIRFIQYNGGRGGAYLFLPKGEASEYKVQDSPQIILEGPLVTKISVFNDNIYHSVILKNSPGSDGQSLEIDNYFNIKNERNVELGMRLLSSIDNIETFYTDLNGFQIIKRKKYDKLPLQANFYPVSGQIFIEDENHRLSLLSSQPMGGTSLSNGEIEVMLDRQLTQDDERGLGHGITDNVLTNAKFKLMFEKRIKSKESANKPENSKIPSGFASLTAIANLNQLLQPTLVLYQMKENAVYSRKWKIGGSLPCDLEVVNLRSLLASKQPGSPSPPSSTLAMTLHRQGFDCSFPSPGLKCKTTNGKLRLMDLIPRYFSDQVRQMSLSHLYDGVNMTKSYSLSLKPMELYSFKLFISAPRKK